MIQTLSLLIHKNTLGLPSRKKTYWALQLSCQFLLVSIQLSGCHLIFEYSPGNHDGQAQDARPVLEKPAGPTCISSLGMAKLTIDVMDPSGGKAPIADWKCAEGSFAKKSAGAAEWSPPTEEWGCPIEISYSATSVYTGAVSTHTWKVLVVRAGDLNRDGMVTGADYLVYQTSNMTDCCKGPTNSCVADLNLDCIVDKADTNIWNAAFGKSGCKCPSP